MSRTYDVPPVPPQNHGSTAAAWTMMLGVVLGSLAVAIGMMIGQSAVLWAGIAVIVLALIISPVMSLAGLGQKQKSRSR